jgi:ELWxxDGT repeat protein
MKKDLLTFLAVVLLLGHETAISQVTLLSNNTDLTSGFVLNGKGLLLSEQDSIWVTTGTAASTVKLVDNVSYVDTTGAAFLNGKVYFTGLNAANGSELWATDATTAGTTLIKDINSGAAGAMPSDYFVYSNKLFFTANNGTDGIELWVSDGTAAGTTMLKDINPGAGSAFTFSSDPAFHVTNSILYFTATDGTMGRELWRTDGTAAGTTMVKDITTGAPGTQFGQFINLGNVQIFGVTAGSSTAPTFQLWRSDGTNAGTTLIRDFGSFSGFFPVFFYPFNNKIYFNGSDFAATGNELWVTDGTTAGTTLVKDINPGGGFDKSSTPFLFNAVVVNNKFYFYANTAANGTELWSSDGTQAGTQLLKDINPGANDADPIIFKSFDYSSIDFYNTDVFNFYNNNLYNGKFFFSADDGSHGKELWISDGTAAGTVLVKDIKPGTADGLSDSTYSYFYTTLGLFFTADNGSGNEPWLSNGTDAGTTMVADVNPGAPSSLPEYMFVLNNQLYFNASNGDNPTRRDLYKIDATVQVLPITLLDFSAIVQASNAVELNWTTTNEINSSHFVIERSIDGNKFNDINRVSATGNSTIKQNYKYLDEQVANINSSIVYYRLKLVDKDGLNQTSKVLRVNLKGGGIQFTFLPNPVKQQLNVIVSPGNAKKVAIRIVDATGKQVFQQNIASGTNAYQQYINVAALQKGIYYIQLITDNTVKTERFLKD